MNIQSHPELLDRLASQYALGSLRAGARRRLEAMARQQPPVRAAMLIWQARLASLAELQPTQNPAPEVWTRIHNLVDADVAQQAMRNAAATSTEAASGGWLRSLGFWRGLAFASVAAAVLAMVNTSQVREGFGQEVAALQTRLATAPQIQYVAVLVNAQPGAADAAASMLVTFDARSGQLVLQRVGNYQETADKSLQLWALPPSGVPRSLGVLGPDRVLRLPAAPGEVREVPALAISLEPHGGVPSAGGPTGPVLFKGALIQKTS